MEKDHPAYGTLKWLYDNDEGSFIYLHNLQAYWRGAMKTMDTGASYLNFLALSGFIELFNENYEGCLPRQVKISFNGREKVKEIESGEKNVIFEDSEAKKVEEIEIIDRGLTTLQKNVLKDNLNTDERLRNLELIKTEREVKYFWPFLFGNIIIGLIAGTSLLSDLGWITLKEKQDQK